jgi:glycerol-3-phosphate acyltransferase PlsX
LPVLAQFPKLEAVSVFHNCEISISMDDKPSKALRRGRWKSGMWKAVETVKHGQASVCVSAGNTGALMAMSKFCLRTLPGIDRPAMSAIWPTLKGESIVLDVGASIGATSGQLVEFAVMGSAMARALSENSKPTVGLLNIGVEEVKGLENVRAAGQILREAELDSMQYHGFVEGNDIGAGTVDVVVTEGFSGNIALKTAEGTAKQMASHLATAMNRTMMTKIGYLFAKSAFVFLREKLDTRSSNGAVLLGLNGVVIKSHGGTDKEGFAVAVEMGHDMAANGLLEKISRDLKYFSTQKEQE